MRCNYCCGFGHNRLTYHLSLNFIIAYNICIFQLSCILKLCPFSGSIKLIFSCNNRQIFSILSIDNKSNLYQWEINFKYKFGGRVQIITSFLSIGIIFFNFNTINHFFPKLQKLLLLWFIFRIIKVKINKMRIFISSVDNVPNFLILFYQIILKSSYLFRNFMFIR